MDTIYIYKINTPSGLVVKLGCTTSKTGKPEKRMLDYSNQHGLSIDSKTLNSKEVKDGQRHEKAIHDLFLSKDYHQIPNSKYGPREMFQSDYIRTFDDALSLFNSSDFVEENLLADTTKKWHADDLVNSEIADTPIEQFNDNCLLTQIVEPNKNENRGALRIQKGLIKVIDGGNNFEHLHLLIIHDICKEFDYVLMDKEGNEYKDFPRTIKYIDSCIAKKQTHWDKIPEWRELALEAARDFVTNPDFNDIDKDIGSKHYTYSHLFMTAKILLQKDFSLLKRKRKRERVQVSY